MHLIVSRNLLKMYICSIIASDKLETKQIYAHTETHKKLNVTLINDAT